MLRALGLRVFSCRVFFWTNIVEKKMCQVQSTIGNRTETNTQMDTNKAKVHYSGTSSASLFYATYAKESIEVVLRWKYAPFLNCFP